MHVSVLFQHLVSLIHCSNETLRLMPAVLAVLRRWVPKGSGGIFVSGRYASESVRVATLLSYFYRFIPEETEIFVPPYCIQRNPQYFYPLSDTFWPERWIISQKEDEKQPQTFVHNLAAFIPFSFGPMNCVGKQLAYREMRIVIASILRHFDICFADGYDADKWFEEMHDDMILAKGDLPVVLTKRVN